MMVMVVMMIKIDIIEGCILCTYEGCILYIVYCILYDQRVGQGEHKLNLSFVMMLMVLILMMVMMMFMMMIMIKVIEGCIMFAGCNRRGSFPRLSSSDGKQGLSVFQSFSLRQ